jgi:hypothetical protein
VAYTWYFMIGSIVTFVVGSLVSRVGIVAERSENPL